MRLRWYGHIKRMEENNKVRAVADIIVPGKRPREREREREREIERERDRERDRERQETERDRERDRDRERWMDCVRSDMQEMRITPEDAQDRTGWKSRIRAADPT